MANRISQIKHEGNILQVSKRVRLPDMFLDNLNWKAGTKLRLVLDMKSQEIRIKKQR